MTDSLQDLRDRTELALSAWQSDPSDVMMLYAYAMNQNTMITGLADVCTRLEQTHGSPVPLPSPSPEPIPALQTDPDTEMVTAVERHPLLLEAALHIGPKRGAGQMFDDPDDADDRSVSLGSDGDYDPAEQQTDDWYPDDPVPVPTANPPPPQPPQESEQQTPKWEMRAAIPDWQTPQPPPAQAVPTPPPTAAPEPNPEPQGVLDLTMSDPEVFHPSKLGEYNAETVWASMDKLRSVCKDLTEEIEAALIQPMAAHDALDGGGEFLSGHIFMYNNRMHFRSLLMQLLESQSVAVYLMERHLRALMDAPAHPAAVPDPVLSSPYDFIAYVVWSFKNSSLEKSIELAIKEHGHEFPHRILVTVSVPQWIPQAHSDSIPQNFRILVCAPAMDMLVSSFLRLVLNYATEAVPRFPFSHPTIAGLPIELSTRHFHMGIAPGVQLDQLLAMYPDPRPLTTGSGRLSASLFMAFRNPSYATMLISNTDFLLQGLVDTTVQEVLDGMRPMHGRGHMRFAGQSQGGQAIAHSQNRVLADDERPGQLLVAAPETRIFESYMLHAPGAMPTLEFVPRYYNTTTGSGSLDE